ncbi:MAG: hypothetical protein ACFFAO_05060 [Candidatus Hermodarchaeota archaeon]
MREHKDNIKKQLDEDEVERILEVTWENWASRRRCEKAHQPNYIKNHKKENRENQV